MQAGASVLMRIDLQRIRDGGGSAVGVCWVGGTSAPKAKTQQKPIKKWNNNNGNNNNDPLQTHKHTKQKKFT